MRTQFAHQFICAHSHGYIFGRIQRVAACCQNLYLDFLLVGAAVDAEFVQIAETLCPYAQLGEVYLSYRDYPFLVLIKGNKPNA